MQLTALPRAKVQRLIQHGFVHVNGSASLQDYRRVEPGDRVVVEFDPHNIPREAVRPWHDAGFRIVHEDEHLIVVDKAAGILTVPTGPEVHASKTLVTRITTYLQKTHRGKKALVVHRLDQGTSGLLVFAKTQVVADRLSRQFEARKPQRLYHALVAGSVADDQGTFRSHLITLRNLDRRSIPGSKGELAITHYRVIRRYKDVTHVECQLETGRRNQIRVHFAEAGHPVLGDPRYEPAKARHPKWTFKGRIALHAATLGFTHPITAEPLTFESPLPREFEKLLGRRSSR